MLEAIDVAIVGATGAVGEALLKILEERDFPDRSTYIRWRVNARLVIRFRLNVNRIW